MPTVGIEPALAGSEQPQIYTLDSATTEIETFFNTSAKLIYQVLMSHLSSLFP
jgi:hypothetical protein